MGAAGPLVVQRVSGNQGGGPVSGAPCPWGGTHGAGEPAAQGQADARRGRDDHGERHGEDGESARNAATDMAMSAGWPSARPPTRRTAWATMASTAGARPV